MSSCLLVTISHCCGKMPGNVGKVYLAQCLRNDTVYHGKMSYYMVHCVRNCHSVLQSDFNIFSNDNMTTEYSSQHFASLVWHNLSNGIGIQEVNREKYLCLCFYFPPFSSISGLSTFMWLLLSHLPLWKHSDGYHRSVPLRWLQILSNWQ